MSSIGNKHADDAAIVGYAARLPGADGIAEVWETLAEGKCRVGQIPADRWSSIRYFDPNREASGKSYARHAGLLDGVYDFDAGYFGLTPREAEQMDPQQRILLETVARAFDHAGIDPADLDKERTGVFVGAASSDHSTTCLQDPAMIDAQYMLGNTLSIISNRLAYHWDIQGPSYTVDTACSSGLFALDQARQAIASGAVDTAIVGSVNVLLSPMPFIGFSKASMLSPTGLCHAFGCNADGYVRAEGAVVFILRKVELAAASHDNIRSFLAATGTNSNGRTAGIAMPSSARQSRLLEHVKSKFGISPSDLAFVEAHGTGTLVGDPEEARAIGMAYGQYRDAPLPIGSAKSNFGHLEPAAGLVGLLKAQLALENDILPPTLHAEELNPDIPFQELGLDVATRARDLPKRDAPWLAAVNSFGFGGANAHAVLRQAPGRSRPDVAMPKALLLSAESQASLHNMALNWQAAANRPEADLAVMATNANTRLARHRHRLCIPIKEGRLADDLTGWLDGDNRGSAIEGVSRSKTDARIGFVFSGNGSQWAGMGRYMLLKDNVFRDTFSAANEIALRLGSQSLLELIMSPELEAQLDRAPSAQPLLLAIQIAMVEALAAKGVRPAAVLGHSAGEVAAAYASGAILMEDAVRIIVARSNALDQLYSTGTMAALVCDEQTASELIATAGLRISIAAENSTQSLTVSGTTEDVAHLLKICRKKRIVGKRLPIDYPYHSDLTDPLRTQLLEQLDGIKGRPTSVTLYSGCKGAAIPGTALNTEFWWDNARNKVRFREGIEAMAADGIQMFLEISPKSVLQSYVRDCLTESGHNGTVLGTLEQTNAERIDAASIAMTVLANGGGIDETALFGARVPFVGDLPDYPFDRKEFRMSSDRQFDLFGCADHHPLLGSRLSPEGNTWSADLSVSRLPWLADHKVDGRILLPASAIMEMFLAAASEVGKTGAVELRNLEILRPIQFNSSDVVTVRVVHDAVARRLSLESRSAGEWSWVAGAALFQAGPENPIPVELDQGEPSAALYPTLARFGLDYGPAFARVSTVQITENRADVRLKPGGTDKIPFKLNPTSTDAALHALLPMLKSHLFDGRYIFVPASMGRIRWFGGGPVTGARLMLNNQDAAGARADVSYVDDDGHVVAIIEELRLRPMTRSGEAQPMYWIERAIPIQSGLSSRAVTSNLEATDNQPTDLEVLRDSIGGRLAWDIVAGNSNDTVMDRRFDAAFAALEAMELASLSDNGGIVLAGVCPWPDIATLLNLLIETQPGAADEIEATLHGMVSDRRNDSPGHDRMAAAAVDLVDSDLHAGQRILLAGQIDPTLVRHLVADAGYLVIAVEQDDEAETLRLNLEDASHCLITTFEALENQPGFDLIVSLAGAEFLSSHRQKLLAGQGADGARLLFVDYAIDLFEIMTGRYAGDEFLGRLDGNETTGGTENTRQPCPSAAHVLFLSANVSTSTAAITTGVTILGNGEFANTLRDIAGDVAGESATIIALEPVSDLTHGVMSQSRALRGLKDQTSPVWLVQKGLDGAAALRGWRRVLANETGREIRCASIHDAVDPSRLLHLIAESREHELTVLPDSIQSRRVLPLRSDVHRAPADQNAKLTQTTRGRLDTFVWSADPARDPADGEVELAVEATALNFRDVMWAQGLLPGDLLEGGFAGPTLGMECSGVVTRAGARSGYMPGQRVLAFSPNAFSTHITVSAEAVTEIPEDLDLASAAAIPVIFVTAEYALSDLARLRPGDWCLIHGGAGGVGLAAIQVAQRAKARIIASAGSDKKRALLRAIRVDHVCDSRSLAFSDEVREITDGHGVDVVLNSLAGEAMERGIGCLAPFGRFVELGKRDFMANTAIGLRALKDNISYFAVDADQLLCHRPEIVRDIMERVVEAFSTGDYHLPPVRRFPAARVADAFRLMQRSGHIGKIIVTPPKLEKRPACPTPSFDGGWLITGGTRGFGFATAEWLADRGADRFWLVSRTGKIEDNMRLEALRAKGVKADVLAVDLTDESCVQSMMQEITAGGAPLTGIVNAAAVFEDSLFEESDDAALQRVIEAKLTSARLLGRASRGIGLQHFWLYSSVAARFGNPGQSAYVVANLELETLAEKRAARGEPALAVAWGPIGDVGYLNRASDVKDLIERKLGQTMEARAALDSLAKVLNGAPERTTITIAPVDWSRLKSDLAVASGPLFECLDLRQEPTNAEGVLDLADLVATEGEAKARKMLLEILQREAAQIMRTGPSEIDVDRELVDLGFDSLMGMSLKLAMEERLGSTTPLTSVADGMTLSRLTHAIVTNAVEGVSDSVTDSMAERHLTDSDLPTEVKAKIANAAAGQI